MHPVLLAYTYKTAAGYASAYGQGGPYSAEQRPVGADAVDYVKKSAPWQYMQNMWNPAPDVDASRQGVRRGWLPGVGTYGQPARVGGMDSMELAEAKKQRALNPNAGRYGEAEMPGVIEQGASRILNPLAASAAQAGADELMPRLKHEGGQMVNQALAQGKEMVGKAAPWAAGGLGLALLAYLGGQQPQQMQQSQQMPQMPQQYAMQGYNGGGQQLPAYDMRAYR